MNKARTNRVETWRPKPGRLYTPCIKVKDFHTSKGHRSQVLGLKSGRIHHFFSDNEADYFEILQFNDKVLEIMEQFGLVPAVSTLIIAEQLGFKPPRIPGTGKLAVMTTDFLLRIKTPDGSAFAARSVKPSSELSKRRVCEKLAIESEWWRRHGVDDFKVVTEKEIDKNTVENIRLVQQYRLLELKEPFNAIGPKRRNELTEDFLKWLRSRDGDSIEYACCLFEERNGLDIGSGLTIFKHLVANGRLRVDMSVKDLGVGRPLAEKED